MTVRLLPSALLHRDLRPFALPVALLVVWLVLGTWHVVDPRKLPPLSEVAAAVQQQLTQGRIWSGLMASLTRGAIGFAIAVLAGLAAGTLLGLSRWAERLGGPTFNAFRQVAPFAWLPLIGAAFGGGEAAKIAFIAVTAFPTVVINTIEGVRAVSREHVELARVLEIDRLRFVTHIVAPTAAPQILTGLHLGLTTAWLAVIGAEYFLQIAPGVGAILMAGRAGVRMDLVLVGVALTGGVGLGLNLVIVAIEKQLLAWRPSPAKP
jgi:sulfonate transport system permease protein